MWSSFSELLDCFDPSMSEIPNLVAASFVPGDEAELASGKLSTDFGQIRNALNLLNADNTAVNQPLLLRYSFRESIRSIEQFPSDGQLFRELGYV
jgi:hypothetical protein